MKVVDEAFNIVGFPEQEKYMGDMPKDLVPIGKEEQVKIKHDSNTQK